MKNKIAEENFSMCRSKLLTLPGDQYCRGKSALSADGLVGLVGYTRSDLPGLTGHGNDDAFLAGLRFSDGAETPTFIQFGTSDVDQAVSVAVGSVGSC